MTAEDGKKYTLAELASRVRGDLQGPGDRVIRDVRPIDSAGPEHITFIDDPRYMKRLADTRAGAIVAPPDLDVGLLPAIRVSQPYVAFAELLELFHPPEREEIGIAPGAHVMPGASIGQGCNIHPGAYIGKGARIGDRTDVHPGAYVGANVEVGADCVLHPGVTIYAGCRVGDRVIAHAGVVIGSDGFGFAQQMVGDNEFEPVVHRKVPQIGIVVVEDDVEIGANSTIDRATLTETRIGRGTKIDNLVQIGHNCQIGPHSILVAQVGVGGSTILGRYVTIAGQGGLVGHIKLGNAARVAAQAGVTKDVGDGVTVAGSPAMEAGRYRRAYATLERLPEIRRQIHDIEKRLKELEGSVEDD